MAVHSAYRCHMVSIKVPKWVRLVSYSPARGQSTPRVTAPSPILAPRQQLWSRHALGAHAACFSLAWICMYSQEDSSCEIIGYFAALSGGLDAAGVYGSTRPLSLRQYSSCGNIGYLLAGRPGVIFLTFLHNSAYFSALFCLLLVTNLEFL